MVELLFPRTLSEDMRDCVLDTLFRLGQACYTKLETVTFRNLLIYLVYYGFPYPSTPSTDILEAYPIRS